MPERNNKLSSGTDLWAPYAHLWKELQVPAKTVLLREGDVSKKAFYIEKGCMRLWFNNQGKEVTFQFFFENEGVSSIESFNSGQPGLFTLETIEPCTLRVISKKDFDKILSESPELEKLINKSILERMLFYQKLFLSRIKDNPPKRYLDLINSQPAIIQRIPQQYIASYLGITPVSLSRIRNNYKPAKKR
jgi:CRP-like cAMP-binding protein